MMTTDEPQSTASRELSSSLLHSSAAATAVADQLRSAAHERAQATVRFSTEGTILHANDNFLEIVGYELQDVVGRHHSMFVAPEDADSPDYNNFWRALARGEHQTATFRRIAKGRREVWLHATYLPVLDEGGRVVSIVKSATDVTDEKLRTAELEGQVSAIRKALAVVEFDLDGTVTYANRHFLELTGYSKHELLGRHHALLVTPEERAAPEYEAFWRRLRAGQHQTDVFHRLSKTGEHLYLQASYSPIFDLHHTPFKIVKFASDVTEQRRTELAMIEAKEAAVEASKAKSMFLATMSHEIRTPMNGMIAASDLLNNTPLSQEQAELVQVIHSSGETLLALINDILDLSKLEANKMSVVATPTNVAQIVKDLEQIFALQMREKGIHLECVGREQLPPFVEVDGLRLRQVLTNLCSNALKFTHHGRVELGCRYAPHELHELTLWVKDSGIGMDDTSFLFQDFSQEDSTRTRRYGGTGLGLAICKRLVEKMGGQIEVHSEMGHGTEFRVQVIAPPCGSPQVEQHPHLATLPTGLALVVDDNKTNRLIAERVLQRLGWTAEVVCSGQEALRRIEVEPFDVVLMDCQMPEMDGFEATKRIRDLGGHYEHLPIVALTANAMHEDREECLAAGMDGFLPKPIRSEEMARELGRVLTL